LPYGYRWLVEQQLTTFGPWYFIEDQVESDAARGEFRAETAAPNPSAIKDVQPFARHAACDDLAGFVIRGGQVSPEVVQVHLTYGAKPELAGYPGMTVYQSTWDWLADSVVSEMRLVAERLEAYHQQQAQK
jgi:hypothetical protein